MKRTVALGATMVLCVGLLSGCGKDYDTAEDTVFLLKNGKVISTDVEEFDLDTYSKDGLVTYIDEAVEAFNAKHGKGAVEKKKLLVENGTAVLTLEYASVEDFAEFRGTEMFSGSIAESLAAGYDYDLEFASVDGDKIKACDASDILLQDGLKVVVIKDNVNINVAGTILYASAKDTKLVDKKTIGYAGGKNLVTGEAISETEAVEIETEEETQQVEESMDESAGSVGEDEFDLGIDESENVTFDFDESEAVVQNESVTYKYVIYK